jgi:hypothetical protein
VAEAFDFANVEFEAVAGDLNLEGNHGLADKLQMLRLRLCAAKSSLAAADVYMQIVGETEGGQVKQTKQQTRRLVRCVLDVLVRHSREVVGLVCRPAFDEYMVQIFGDWLQNDAGMMSPLLSRLHQSFQKSVKQLGDGNHEAFVSNGVLTRFVRSGSSRPRGPRSKKTKEERDVRASQRLQQEEAEEREVRASQRLQQEEAEESDCPEQVGTLPSQRLQQQEAEESDCSEQVGTWPPQRLQQQEAETAIVPEQDGTWEWLGDVHRPPPAWR